MKVTELNREQLIQLKQRYLIDQAENHGRIWPSWGELALVDNQVSDETIMKEFEGTEFVEEDFSNQ